jgi:hypothetical protein
MKLARTLGVLTLAVFAVAACDDDDTTGVEIDSFAGLWNATQFEYTDDSGRTLPGTSTPPSIDLISSGGSVTLDVDANGEFAGSLVAPGLTPEGGVPISGMISLVNDNTLSIDFDATTLAIVCPTPEACLFESFDATYNLNGDVLTFVNDDTEFDFAPIESFVGLDPAGTVDATLEVTLQR